MSGLVFDLISFKESFFVKECYYTLALVDLQLFMTSSGDKKISYWKRVKLGIKSYFNWRSDSIQMHPFNVKWLLRSLNMWKISYYDWKILLVAV